MESDAKKDSLLTPGIWTSEFKVFIITTVLSFISTVGTGLIEQAVFPSDSVWGKLLVVFVGAIGTLSSTITGAYFIKGRNDQKIEEMRMKTQLRIEQEKAKQRGEN